MKRIINNISIILGSAFLFFYGCTERIEVELESTYDRLVVEGSITTETKAHKVRLTRTGDYFQNRPAEGISAAVVTVDDGTETIVLDELQQEPGSYVTPDDYTGIPGRTYTLNIGNVDIDNDDQVETYDAACTLFPVSPIDSIDFEYNDVWDIWKVLLFAQEPPETEDYYAFRLYRNSVLISDTISEIRTAEDRFFNGSYTNGVWVHWFDEEKEDEVLVNGDLITLEMNGISKGYFDFINQVQEETEGQNPMFSGAPANIKGNISNGALGFFTAYSIARYSKTFHVP